MDPCPPQGLQEQGIEDLIVNVELNNKVTIANLSFLSQSGVWSHYGMWTRKKHYPSPTLTTASRRCHTILLISEFQSPPTVTSTFVFLVVTFVKLNCCEVALQELLMAMSRLICLFFFTVFLNFQIYLFSKLKILVLRFWKGKTGHTTIATCNSHTVPLGPLCLWQWFLNLCWYFLYFQSCNLHFWTTSPHPFPSDLFAKFSSPF